ncbi:MAG TPA: WD40 repeat domain-containing protein [Phototrophicaceae bacterium]|nr:WD40 repeat domain-containing protein [Phototrophicaceae bacterium]
MVRTARIFGVLFLMIVTIIKIWDSPISVTAQESLNQLVFRGRNSDQDVLIFAEQNYISIYNDKLQRVIKLDLALPNSSDYSAVPFTMAWSPNGKVFAALVNFNGLVSNQITLVTYVIAWDATTWKCLSITSGVDGITQLTLSPDGGYMAVKRFTEGSVVGIYDTARGELVREIVLQPFRPLYHLIWDPQNSNKLVISTDKVEVWNPSTGELINMLGSYNSDSAPVFNSRSGLLGVINLNADVDIWDQDTNQIIRTIDNAVDIYSIGWIEDGLITLDFNDSTLLWNIADGSSIVLSTEPNVGAWSFDGTTYVSWNDHGFFLHDRDTGAILAQLLKVTGTPVN